MPNTLAAIISIAGLAYALYNLAWVLGKLNVSIIEEALKTTIGG